MPDRVTGSASGQIHRHIATSDRIPRIVTRSPPPDHNSHHHHRRHEQEHYQDDHRLPTPAIGASSRHHRDPQYTHRTTGATHTSSSQPSPTRKHLFTLPPIESFQHRHPSPTRSSRRPLDYPAPRMNSLDHGGSSIGGWQNSWQNRDIEGGFGHAMESGSNTHRASVPTDTRNYQPSWSSGVPVPRPLSERGPIPDSSGPGRPSYHADVVRGHPQLAPDSSGHHNFANPHFPKPSQFSVEHGWSSTYSSSTSVDPHGRRSNDDPVTLRHTDADSSQVRSVGSRHASDRQVGSVSPTMPSGFALGRVSLSEQRVEQSVPPPRDSQSFRSPRATMHLSTASGTSQYRSLPTVVDSTARGPNASPLHSMRILGEAVSSFGNVSSKISSWGTGSPRERTTEDKVTGQQDRDRPRKRAKTRAGTGVSGKERTEKGSSVVDAREMISAYCDELCDLAEGTAQSDSPTDAQRLSELSRQIVLKLSAIASDAGLDDLVITEQDLESGLEPLSLGTSTDVPRSVEAVQSTRKETEDVTQSLNAPRPMAKPTSVMNVQTPQEAARDMEFIRTRRDELNAKAAAAEKEKEGKDRENLDTNGSAGQESEAGEQLRPSKMETTSPTAPARTAQPASQPQATSPPLDEPLRSTSSGTLQASIAPIQRHPYRMSTYEPFMPFPYMTSTAVMGATGLIIQRQPGAAGSVPLSGTELSTNVSNRSCHSCGITQTSEWKLGPDGPDTLCGVCGVHWLQQAQTWSMLPPYLPMFKVGGEV